MGSVRRWTLEDLPAVRDVLWTTWESAYSGFIPTADLRSYFSAHYSIETLAAQLSDPDRVDLLGERDGCVEAVLRVRIDHDARRTYVSSLYVLPSAQGHGWGFQLMCEAASIAERQGHTNLWLGVMIQNAPAVAWYRKYGFTVEEEQPFTMGSTTVPHYIGWLPAAPFLTRAGERTH